MQQERHKDPRSVMLGQIGGQTRAARLTPLERREIASMAAKARWHRQQYQDAKQLADMMVQFAKQKLRDGSIAPQL